MQAKDFGRTNSEEHARLPSVPFSTGVASQRSEVMKFFLIVDFCSLVMKRLFLNGDF